MDPEQTDGCWREDWIKEGEAISQRTRLHEPWTWTTVWDCLMWGGQRWAGGGKVGTTGIA